MRGILVGLLVTAACYAPKVAPGTPCADNGLCPQGQTCAGGFCALAGLQPDAGGDAGDASPAGDAGGEVSITDRDGDGVENSIDNCPDDKNADQGNEDGDPFGDVCDPCPQLADTAIADKDGDHIGDACDPNAAADVLWLFEGFHNGLPSWPASVNWQVVADAAQVTAQGPPAQRGEYLLLPLTRQGRMAFDNYSTVVSFTVTQVGPGTDHEVGIEYYDSSVDQSLECELADLNGSRFLWLNDETSLDQRVPFAWTNGTQYVLRLVRHGANYTCDVIGPGAPAPATGTSTLAPRGGADTDPWVYGATARIGSVSVVGPAP